MGKYDVIDKRYFGNAQRFAELITVGVFRNQKQVKGDELAPLPKKYPSLGIISGEYERDVLS